MKTTTPVWIALGSAAALLATQVPARADVKTDKSVLNLTLAPDDTLTGDTQVGVSVTFTQQNYQPGGCTKMHGIALDASAGSGDGGGYATINNSNGLCNFNPWDATPYPIPVDLTAYDTTSGSYVFEYYDLCPSPSYSSSVVSDVFEIDAYADPGGNGSYYDAGYTTIPFNVTCLPDSVLASATLTASPTSLALTVEGSTVDGNADVMFDLSRQDGDNCAMADGAYLFYYPNGRQAGQKQVVDSSSFDGSTCAVDVPFLVDPVTDDEVLARCAGAPRLAHLTITKQFDADFCNGDCSSNASAIVERHSIDYVANITCPPAVVYKPKGPLELNPKVVKPAVKLTKIPTLFRAQTSRGYTKGGIAPSGAVTAVPSFSAHVRYVDFDRASCTRAGTVAVFGPNGATVARQSVAPSCALNQEVTFAPWSGAELARVCGGDRDGRIKKVQETVTLKVCPAGRPCGVSDAGQARPMRVTGLVQCGATDRPGKARLATTFLRGLRPGAKPSILPRRVAPRPHRP